MPDDVNPSEGETQQAPDAAPTPGTGAPASTPEPTPGQSQPDWEGRYNGAMRVLSQRDKQIQELQEQIDAASGSVGELTTQLETAQAGSAAKEQSLGEQLVTLTT